MKIHRHIAIPVGQPTVAASLAGTALRRRVNGPPYGRPRGRPCIFMRGGDRPRVMSVYEFSNLGTYPFCCQKGEFVDRDSILMHFMP